ncbi:MAG: DUF309 domain-containing protein [Sulfolobaceae archaeon]|nr:DUF309 domain-containing protein [Sulfolobaceae archaeon]
MEVERAIYIYPKDENIDYETLKRELRNMGLRVVDIRVCRMVEIDVLGKGEEKKEEEVLFKLLGNPIDVIYVGRNINKSLDELLSNGFYWLIHETLEDKWRKTEGEEKELLHSAILIAVALIKFCKGEYEIARQTLLRSYQENPIWMIILTLFLTPLLLEP